MEKLFRGNLTNRYFKGKNGKLHGANDGLQRFTDSICALGIDQTSEDLFAGPNIPFLWLWAKKG
jgi:hypothetical protein